MSFKNFYRSQKVDFDKINLAMFHELQDYAFNSKNKKGINKFLLMNNEQLSENKFFEKYPHLV